MPPAQYLFIWLYISVYNLMTVKKLISYIQNKGPLYSAFLDNNTKRHKCQKEK
jgi:hypothetical protein